MNLFEKILNDKGIIDRYYEVFNLYYNLQKILYKLKKSMIKYFRINKLINLLKIIYI